MDWAANVLASTLPSPHPFLHPTHTPGLGCIPALLPTNFVWDKYLPLPSFHQLYVFHGGLFAAAFCEGYSTRQDNMVLADHCKSPRVRTLLWPRNLPSHLTAITSVLKRLRLHQLTAKHTVLVWVLFSPVLGVPSWSITVPSKTSLRPSCRYAHRSQEKPLQLPWCDASNYGLGGVLCQYDNGTPHPVSYASRKLLDRERKYMTTGKEALAVVFA
ncbi:uncharacterized protein LOC123501569 [Portunus trituberculatus]|uniref:uncharacterized protein LOC123501569 n=1 Tax=Portunus trituberculatus TaxID=210409 RepID=UPI001E1CC186|nr:uncharacterized protein LOC123501569 [Portunus trituberculatus]